MRAPDAAAIDWKPVVTLAGAALIAYLEAHAELLDEDARRRLHTNPLRILDTKNPAMQDLVNAAPRLMDHLGAESLDHHAAPRQQPDQRRPRGLGLAPVQPPSW